MQPFSLAGTDMHGAGPGQFCRKGRAEVDFLMEGERGKGVAAIDSLITTKLHRLEEAAHRRYLTGELPP